MANVTTVPSMPRAPAGSATEHEQQARGVGLTASAAGRHPNTTDQQLVQAVQALTTRLDGLGTALATILERLGAIEGRLDCTETWQQNLGLRAQNRSAAQGGPDGASWPLKPLQKEKQPAAGGAAAGSLPPAGLVPATLDALDKLSTRKLNQLQEFYQEQFLGDTVNERRWAFRHFITSP